LIDFFLLFDLFLISEKGADAMKNLATLPRSAKVRIRGQITIPQDIREDLNLDEQTMVNIFRVGKVVLVTPKRLERASLARRVEREMKREGLTLEDLLSDLRSQRKRYVEEAHSRD
jgi:AbrB family looped-hinge helix DNA binding protein